MIRACSLSISCSASCWYFYQLVGCDCHWRGQDHLIQLLLHLHSIQNNCNYSATCLMQWPGMRVDAFHWSWLLDLFVCLGLTSLWNFWGHITTVPACSSGTLTNVLPHRNAMPQTQDMTTHPVTVYRHRADLSLCYPFMWNVTLEYTATHFNVLGETWPGNPSPTFHTHQRTLNLMLLWWSTVGSSVESTVPIGSWTRDLWCANPVRYPLAHSYVVVRVTLYPDCVLVFNMFW